MVRSPVRGCVAAPLFYAWRTGLSGALALGRAASSALPLATALPLALTTTTATTASRFRAKTLASATLRATAAGLARVGLGFGLQRQVVFRLEAFHFLARQLLLDQLFDARQQFAFVGTHQRQRMATFAGTAGTTNAVHVVFRHVGQFKVHNLWQLFDIQATGSNVGGNQHAHFTGFKIRQRTGTGTLRLVAVNGGGGDAVLFQLLGQAVGAVLGAGEYQHLVPGVVTHQLAQQRGLLALVNRVYRLLHLLGGGITGRHFHLHRVIQQALGQGADFVGEGGRHSQDPGVAARQAPEPAVLCHLLQRNPHLGPGPAG